LSMDFSPCLFWSDLGDPRSGDRAFLTMWEARTQVVSSGFRFQIFQGTARLSFRELFNLLENDSDFGRWYGETLAGCGLAAFFCFMIRSDGKRFCPELTASIAWRSGAGCLAVSRCNPIRNSCEAR
jgi:hypothetical protein